MTPTSPVIPGYENLEFILAKDQPEYVSLPAVGFGGPNGLVVTRWSLSDEEREMIADGADIVLQQLTHGRGFSPVNLQVTMSDEQPELLVM